MKLSWTTWMSAGIFGLMDAIAAFDLEPRRGVKFEKPTQAPRIRGALSSTSFARWTGCRAWCSRPQARLGEQAARSRAWPAQPTNDEIASCRLKVSMGEFGADGQGRRAPAARCRCSRKWFETDSNKDVREIDVLEDKRGADPKVARFKGKDLKELMTKGLSRGPSGSSSCSTILKR